MNVNLIVVITALHRLSVKILMVRMSVCVSTTHERMSVETVQVGHYCKHITIMHIQYLIVAHMHAFEVTL